MKNKSDSLYTMWKAHSASITPSLSLSEILHSSIPFHALKDVKDSKAC